MLKVICRNILYILSVYFDYTASWEIEESEFNLRLTQDSTHLYVKRISETFFLGLMQ